MDVNHVKTAIRTLQSCKWLYRHVQEESIDDDEATKHIIEVSNHATTEMLTKVSPDEVMYFRPTPLGILIAGSLLVLTRPELIIRE